MTLNRGIKDGVRVEGIQPEIVLAYTIACGIFDEVGYPCHITSVRDGKHSNTSLHYRGMALDLRCPSWYGAQPTVDTEVRDALRKALGVQYDVMLEGVTTPGASGPHLHVEFDPPVSQGVHT